MFTELKLSLLAQNAQKTLEKLGCQQQQTKILILEEREDDREGERGAGEVEGRSCERLQDFSRSAKKR